MNQNKSWEELMTCITLIQGQQRRRLQQFFAAVRTCLPTRCLETTGGYIDRPTLTLLWYDTDRTQNVLPSSCLATLTYGAEPFLKSCQLCSHSKTSQHFMEPEISLLCSQELSTGTYPEPDRSNPYYPILACLATHTYKHTDWWKAFMKYAVDMPSGAMYIWSSTYDRPHLRPQKKNTVQYR
jgi:hypothetical protein